MICGGKEELDAQAEGAAEGEIPEGAEQVNEINPDT